VTFDEKSGMYFGFDQSNIDSASAGALSDIVKVFEKYPDINILLEGHTDDKVADNYNIGLSQCRTIAVRELLCERRCFSFAFNHQLVRKIAIEIP